MKPNSESKRHAATQAVLRLQSAGHTAYWAGGCVRDQLLGIPPSDYDIATDALPDRVMELFPESTAVGKSFGVIVAPFEGVTHEIATFRKDHAYQDGRHPSHISFVTVEEDSQRRDFTINAMFYDPIADTLFDFTGGQDDLDAKVIRCVGDSEIRFKEDHLRMLRAVRFASRLGFTIESETATAIQKEATLVARISPERIQTEITRLLLESKQPGQAVLLLESLGLLNVILPEVSDMRGQEQPPEFHPEGDVLTHTVMMLDAMDNPDDTLAYATLFHDLGKPPTATDDGERIRFFCHAERGAEMAHDILTRLKCSSRLIETVTHCVRNHMRFGDVQQMRRSTLRRLVGSPTFETELELHRLDCTASHGMLDNHTFLKEVQSEMANEPILPPPWISGHDLITLGIKEGPMIGKWLKFAYDAQLENKFESADTLREWLSHKVQLEQH
jgi:poly(A) polymerase